MGHNDDGGFPHNDPCVLMLRDGHYFNIWQYEKLFMDVDGPCASARKHCKGSVELYEKCFCLLCMVSYSSQSLHVCQHRCKGCLATADEHVMNVYYGCGTIEKVCEKCKYTFTNDFCYETLHLRKLSGKLVIFWVNVKIVMVALKILNGHLSAGTMTKLIIVEDVRKMTY